MTENYELTPAELAAVRAYDPPPAEDDPKAVNPVMHPEQLAELGAPVAGLCTCGGANCFGYKGVYDAYSCICECHDKRYTEANGRRLCQAGDDRWAEPGWTACRFHRAYGKEAER